MLVDGKASRTLWPAAGQDALFVIDQRQLPHRVVVERLADPAAVHRAIRDMWVRGAPLIGATAAYGVALQCNRDAGDAALHQVLQWLADARPTAVNLAWALQRMRERLLPLPVAARCAAAWAEAAALCDEDVAVNQAIGQHGLALIQAIAERRPGPVRVLTHCNAGWVATVDRGTAISPVYAAQEAGIEVFVWVDETRPRN